MPGTSSVETVHYHVSYHGPKVEKKGKDWELRQPRALLWQDGEPSSDAWEGDADYDYGNPVVVPHGDETPGSVTLQFNPHWWLSNPLLYCRFYSPLLQEVVYPLPLCVKCSEDGAEYYVKMCAFETGWTDDDTKPAVPNAPNGKPASVLYVLTGTAGNDFTACDNWMDASTWAASIRCMSGQDELDCF